MIIKLDDVIDGKENLEYLYASFKNKLNKDIRFYESMIKQNLNIKAVFDSYSEDQLTYLLNTDINQFSSQAQTER